MLGQGIVCSIHGLESSHTTAHQIQEQFANDFNEQRFGDEETLATAHGDTRGPDVLGGCR